jgi:hypothetical protein
MASIDFWNRISSRVKYLSLSCSLTEKRSPAIIKQKALKNTERKGSGTRTRPSEKIS